MFFAGENLPRTFGSEYDGHKIFQDLKDIMNFYETLSWSNYNPVEYAGLISRSKVLSTSTYVFGSLAGTMESIFVLLHNGRCNDALALIRKYCDTIILDIYLRLLTKDLNETVLEKESIQSIINNKVTNWIDSEGRLFDEKKINIVYDKISKSEPKLTQLFNLRDSNALYKKLRDLCNDNMHNNYLFTIMANDANMIKVREDIRKIMLKNASIAIRYFFSIHFAFIYCEDCAFMMSSDYMDHLELGSKPPEGSERWLANSVLTAFEIVKSIKPSVAEYLISLDLMDLE